MGGLISNGEVNGDRVRSFCCRNLFCLNLLFQFVKLFQTCLRDQSLRPTWRQVQEVHEFIHPHIEHKHYRTRFSPDTQIRHKTNRKGRRKFSMELLKSTHVDHCIVSMYHRTVELSLQLFPVVILNLVFSFQAASHDEPL